MRVLFYTHEKDCASVREAGWRLESSMYEGAAVAAPRKEDIVILGDKRHVVREVQWVYIRTGAGASYESIAEASVYLWRTT